MTKPADPVVPVTPVNNLDQVRELVFDLLADHSARLCCGCEDCDPSPHEDTGLASFNGTIYLTIDDRHYSIQINECEDPLG